MIIPSDSANITTFIWPPKSPWLPLGISQITANHNTDDITTTNTHAIQELFKALSLYKLI
jgi:hypothetical protein